ncbi:MAG: aminoglycoside phosphotransferase family protein [Steroidobacteraceae bacterium]
MQAVIDRIIRIYNEEENDPRPALTRSDIPQRWESVTTNWLTQVICTPSSAAEVTSFRFGPRDDGTSNRRRIHLTYNDAGNQIGLPATVFCKASIGLENRIALGTMGCSHAESTFYSKARPQLDIEAPRAYLANYDPESFAAIAVLEDLGGKVHFCDEDTHFDHARAAGQVDTLAALHSRFHDDPRLATPELPFERWSTWFRNLEVAIQMETYCNKGFLAARDVIPPRLYQRAAEIWPATLRAVAQHARLPATLLHADAHAKNWYYVLDDGRMGLGDWQACVVGHWSRDYAYTVASSLRIEERRAWEPGLLSRYLERLAAGGVDPPSFENALTYYRQQLFAGLSYWTITLTPAPNMPVMQPEKTTIEIIRRITHAIDDLEALDSFD